MQFGYICNSMTKDLEPKSHTRQESYPAGYGSFCLI
nr:MAG TPA: hypothetical protein [Caudoviricetes sp.]